MELECLSSCWQEGDVTPIKGGVAARSVDLGLVGHGLEEAEALEALRDAIAAWCNGLRALDALEPALRRRHLKWEPNDSSLDVELMLP
jgi:hypothetical protein